MASTQSSWRSHSSPGGMRRCASEGAICSQARLLRDRGDLQQGRGRFEAQLPKVRPIVRQKDNKPVITRIGMELGEQEQRSGLFVLEIDQDPLGKTPVAQLNSQEGRQAIRGEGERHASFAIKPGDRIREIHAETPDKSLRNATHVEQGSSGGGNTMSASEMMAELAAATSETSPRVVNLSVSRNIANVLKPSDEFGISGTEFHPGSTKSNLGAKATSPLPPKPPATPPLGTTASSTSPAMFPQMRRRSASSTGFSRQRSGSPAIGRRSVETRFVAPPVELLSNSRAASRQSRATSRQSSARGEGANERGSIASPHRVSPGGRSSSSELRRLSADKKQS